LLKLNPSNLAILDYYTPYNVLTYGGSGLCSLDHDFGSGGVLLAPDYSYNGKSVVINGDKQSNVMHPPKLDRKGLDFS
jgi:hypothetical protein